MPTMTSFGKTVVINPGWEVKFHNDANAFMKFIAKTYVDQVQKTIFDSKPSGRWYHRKQKGGWYRASAPGQPPAIDTWTLVRAIVYGEIKEGNGKIVGYGVGIKAGSPAATYGLVLEFGNSRIKPRPYFRPSLPKTMRIVRNYTSGNFGAV